MRRVQASGWDDDELFPYGGAAGRHDRPVPGVGYLIGGAGRHDDGLLFAVGTNLFAYWNADKMVLRMYGAREVDAATAPQFYGMVQQLGAGAGLPMPQVYIIENDQPNAFATGRNPENAAVAATTGPAAPSEPRGSRRRDGA